MMSVLALVLANGTACVVVQCNRMCVAKLKQMLSEVAISFVLVPER